MRARVPQFLHLPPQILWFDTHELLILVAAYIGSLFLKGYAWVGMMALAVVVIRFKRQKPRGYIAHLFYRAGLFQLKHYPAPIASRFDE